jgi:hypothetical protein
VEREDHLDCSEISHSDHRVEFHPGAIGLIVTGSILGQYPWSYRRGQVKALRASAQGSLITISTFAVTTPSQRGEQQLSTSQKTYFAYLSNYSLQMPFFPEEPLHLATHDGFGYFPSYPGHKLNNNRYQVIRKLGYGPRSSVWLVVDFK